MKAEGFRPSKINKKELHIFTESAELILNNSQKILNCGEYFHCKPSFSFVSTFYFGGGHIPLGVLVLGFERDILRDWCPNCGEVNRWVLSLGGGLSIGWKWGLCLNCKIYSKTEGSATEYIPVWKDLIPLIMSFPSKGYVEVEKQSPKFSWSNGIIYKNEKIIEKVVYYNPLSLEEVIHELINGKERKCSDVVYSFKDPELQKAFMKKESW